MWRPAEEGWEDEVYSPAEIASWHYHAPLMLPADLAAREAAAFKRGQEAMRERLVNAAVAIENREEAHAAQAEACDYDHSAQHHGARAEVLREAIAAIRALPVEEMS